MILQLKLLVILFWTKLKFTSDPMCWWYWTTCIRGNPCFSKIFTIVPSNSHPHLLPHSHHPSEATMPSDYRCMGLLHNPHSLKSSHNQKCHNCPASSHGYNRGFSKCYIPYPMLFHKTSTCTFPIFPHEKVMYLYTGLSPWKPHAPRNSLGMVEFWCLCSLLGLWWRALANRLGCPCKSNMFFGM